MLTKQQQTKIQTFNEYNNIVRCCTHVNIYKVRLFTYINIYIVRLFTHENKYTISLQISIFTLSASLLMQIYIQAVCLHIDVRRITEFKTL